MTPIEQFKKRMAAVERPRILYTGAKVWPGSVNNDHSVHAPHGEWISTDIEGPGVDIVGDLQRIHEVTDERFDAIFSPATLEHIERPWCAVTSMGMALNPGGLLFIHTHQTFPLHGYPHDYFRFSTEALKTLCYDAGLATIASGYDHPCQIIPPASVTVWNAGAECYLNVNILAEKPC